jgi:hypothetical protein
MKAKYISKLERTERYHPTPKKGPDLSGLTDEELNLIIKYHSEEELTAEEAAQLETIASKIPGVE